MMIFIGIMIMLFSFVGIVFTLSILAPILEFWAMTFLVFIILMFFVYIIFVVMKSGKYIKEEIDKINEKIKKSIKE